MARPGADLLFVGDVYCDLVLADAPPPQPGTEVFAAGFRLAAGGVANRAVAAARAGARVVLVSRLGDDPLGAHLQSVLEGEEGLDTTFLETVPGHQSPVTVSLTGPDDRSFVTYLERLPEPEVSPEVGPVRAVHTGVAREIPGWVAPLRTAGASVYGGVGWDHEGTWSSLVLDRLDEVDVFVPNEVEALRYTRCDDVVTAAKVLAERVPLVVVTRGPAGALALDSGSGSLVEVTAPTVPVLDPTGAGDVFVATLMAAGLQDWDLATRLRFAALSASLSVTGLGGAASAPRPHDLVSFVERERPPGDWSFLPRPDTLTPPDPRKDPR